MTREPDYVVNVWSDGQHRCNGQSGLAASDLLRRNRLWRLYGYTSISYRIFVFLKPSAQEKRE